jgi:glucose-6-phosphate 1-dehydrogenase
MTNETMVRATTGTREATTAPPADPCLMVIFGASGDLTRRLLMPALYNLACDRLLPQHFAIVGIAMDELTTEQFRARMTENVRHFNTRPTFDEKVWADFVSRIHYTPGNFADPEAYQRLARLVDQVDTEVGAEGNVLFYMATPPAVFGLVSTNLDRAGFKKRDRGWTRIVVEKPFGNDLPSAVELNRTMLAHWSEDQIYRIDHYLGKETVQNLLAFRFSNGIFEPVWNKNQIDHIQFTVSETVGVEGRGKYYDKAGVLRDMIQNHMFQMLAYVCMEPPASFAADAIRNEKAKLLESIRILAPEAVPQFAVRGQYGPGRKPDGTPAAGYRQEPDVDPHSCTETFAAVKLLIDNWRWDGVPIYLRSGKALWKRGTEIVVEFKRAPEVVFRHTPAAKRMEPNRLFFHIQPDQGIELRFHAKTPGPAMHLQKVTMRFDYSETFEASRGTGYEVLLYNVMIGDATLFSRTDLVESAWRIAQPVLDYWAAHPPTDFPNYPAGSWGPKAAFELLERDGRRWLEIVNREVLARVPLFQKGDPVLLHNLALSLRPVVFEAGEFIIRRGEIGGEMYFICRGQVEVLDGEENRIGTHGEGDFFGELSLLLAQPRVATIRALSPCDLFVLAREDFQRVLEEHPDFAATLRETARTRYNLPPGTL